MSNPETARAPPSSDEESGGESEVEEGPDHANQQIPDAVDHFLAELLKSLQTRNTPQIHVLYEETFNNITKKYYTPAKKSSDLHDFRWPCVEAVEAQISKEPLFIILYRELYYRHIYRHLGNTMTYEDRKGSWENYARLLGLFISDLEEGSDLSAAVPAQWLWDIVDEFAYQYQTYCMFRNISCKKQKDADIAQLRKNPEVFETKQVLGLLHALVRASQIREWLANPENPEGKGGAFTYESVRLLGYFSLVQLLRMHSLLGDYRLAMQTMECLDFQAEVPLFYKIPVCHITLYYYMGFAYIMLRRYVDAIRTFSSILVFLSKTSGVNNLSYQYETMVRKQEQMYALLLLCMALCPQPLDESLDKALKEKDKNGEKQAKLQQGEESAFEDLFNYACPKFVSAAAPDFERLDVFNQNEAHQRQLQLFLQEVKQQQFLPVIGSYMKLYTSLKTSKLAQLCEMDEEGLRDQLLCVMHKTRQHVRPQKEPPLAGELQPCSEVEFYLDGDMVHINAHKPQRPHAEVFLEHILKFQDVLRKMGQS